jgi:hypothetical protein
MKKIVVLLSVLLFFNSFCFAKSAEEAQKILVKKFEEASQAFLSLDYDKSLKLFIEVLEEDKTIFVKENNANKNDINAVVSDQIAKVAMSAFDNTANLKYYKIAKKYSLKSIGFGTKDTEVVEIAIRCGVGTINKKILLDSYAYLCNIDANKCENYRNDVAESLKKINEYKEQAKQAKKDRAKLIFANTCRILGAGLSGYSNAYNSYRTNNPSVTCTTIGNTTYCN